MDDVEAIYEQLRSTDLLSTVEDDLLRRVAGISRRRHVPAGAELVVEGSAPDAVYFLVAGRLRAFVVQDDGVERSVGDIAPGELVGDMAVLVDGRRTATVRAVRDSRVVELDRAGFEKVLLADPAAVQALARLLAARLDRANRGRRDPIRRQTITLLPVPGADPVSVDWLAGSLGIIGDRVRLVGSGDAGDLSEPALTEWMGRVEADNDVTVYLADADLGEWTHRVLRQGDHLLVVDDDPERGLDNRFVETLIAATVGPVAPSVDVVVLQEPARSRPTGGGRWTATTLPVRIHHVRRDNVGDARRVGRALGHRDLSLVLSGGGARGMAHVGVIRAIAEAGLTVDVVGGTSFGAIVAGYLAQGLDWMAMRDELWRVVGRPGAPVDVTLPTVSLSKGRKLRGVLESSFADDTIENLWLRMFCVSSNLTTGHPLVHDRGPVKTALRASVAIPGVFPPVASLDGEVLVDGGIMNNLPIDVMHRFADGGPMIAVNLRSPGALAAHDLPTDGVVPGWRTAIRRVMPGSTPGVPTIAEVLLRSTETGASLAAREMEPIADLVLRPSTDGFAMMDFGALDRLIEVGYAYTMGRIEELLALRDI